MRTWLSRLKTLKKYVSETPGSLIPESQFLNEEDWIESSFRNKELTTERGMSAALQHLDSRAEVNFAGIMIGALQKFLEANGGELPSQLTELKPYFRVSVGDDVLERYELLQKGNVKNIPDEVRRNALVSEKKSVAGSGNRLMIQIGDQSFRNLASY
jgi:hypothetical protein